MLHGYCFGIQCFGTPSIKYSLIKVLVRKAESYLMMCSRCWQN